MKKYQTKYHKKGSLFLMGVCCVLCISAVSFLKTFSVYEVHAEENIMKGNVSDPGDVYFTFYYNNQIQFSLPEKQENVFFDEEKSLCMREGAVLEDVKIVFDQEDWSFKVEGMKSPNTKCSLYFYSA